MRRGRWVAVLLATYRYRFPDPPAWTVELAGQGPGPTSVEGVAFGYGGHDLNLLAENRDVLFVPAGAYER
jgi:hypothetical protein